MQGWLRVSGASNRVTELLGRLANVLVLLAGLPGAALAPFPLPASPLAARVAPARVSRAAGAGVAVGWVVVLGTGAWVRFSRKDVSTS